MNAFQINTRVFPDGSFRFAGHTTIPTDLWGRVKQGELGAVMVDKKFGVVLESTTPPPGHVRRLARAVGSVDVPGTMLITTRGWG